MAVVERSVTTCLAIRGKNDEAISLLSQSIAAGLPPGDALNMPQDPDLKPLRGDPGFEELVAHAREVATAAQKLK